MADYYSILKKTISGLAHNSQGTRTAVYGKARAAIDRQLRAMNPTPSEEAIARQMELLEVAIQKLDGDYSAPSEAVDSVAPAPETAVESASRTPDAPVSPAPIAEPVAPTVASPEISTGQADVSVATPADGYVPAGTVTPSPEINAPVVDPQGMDYSETILAVEPDTQSRESKPAKKSGFLSALIPIVLAMGVIGGGAYALWLNKDALMDGITGGGKPAEEVISEEGNANQAATEDNTANGADEVATDENSGQAEDRNVRVVGEEAPKNADQLTSAGETVEAQPAAPVELPTVPAIDVETPPIENTEQLQSDPNDAASSQQVTEIAEAAKPENQETSTADTASQEASEPATQPSSVTPAVAQKAFLYEEGSSGSDASRDNAAVVWSLATESIDGGAPEAVIKGQLDIPGRSMTMNLAIKRNLDASLPASHIIEISFKLPGDFAGGNISNVSRFVMKSSEQARGEGLVAVPAKISDGNFLIALNNLDQALETNRKLLLESSWIDVPLGYTTGRRALVTLEKGALGNKVFKDAFADWDKR